MSRTALTSSVLVIEGRPLCRSSGSTIGSDFSFIANSGRDLALDSNSGRALDFNGASPTLIVIHSVLVTDPDVVLDLASALN
ncbi:hypothetical protein EVAR_7172_1 [Eumeta japonica]|uniref:Uncharacterized protein n=1 Tax=Eumeta variegata TaxID=151549 RepID=A0A4C1U7X6_EUMVA|nr:hypothetical protein EVAR_7172_1 [Eumeta japonica]